MKAEEYYHKGKEYYQQADYKKALQQFLLACEYDDEDPEYWHCAGRAARLINDTNYKTYLNKTIDLYLLNEESGYITAEEFWAVGAVYALLEDKANSLAYLNKAIVLSDFAKEWGQDAKENEDYAVFHDDADFIALTRDFDRKTRFREYHYQIFQKEKATWNKIDANEFEFYLATPIYVQLLIKKENIADLEQFLESVHWTAVKDDTGNIIDVNVDADMWQTDIISQLASYVENGSEIILRDDGEMYWKIEFNNSKAKFFN